MLSLQVLSCLLAVVVLQFAPLESNAASLHKHMKHVSADKGMGTQKTSLLAKYAKDISLKEMDLEKLTVKTSLFQKKLVAKKADFEYKKANKKVLKKTASHSLKFKKSMEKKMGNMSAEKNMKKKSASKNTATAEKKMKSTKSAKRGGPHSSSLLKTSPNQRH